MSLPNLLHNGNSTNQPAPPQVRPPLTVEEKNEFLVHALRCQVAFRDARERLPENVFDEATNGHYLAMWNIVCRLADQHSNGALPENLRSMLETEIRVDAGNRDVPEAILNPLLGSPASMGQDESRTGGLIDQVFAVDQAELDSTASRAAELLERVVHEYGIVRDFRDFLANCGNGVPTRESLDALLQHAQERQDRRSGGDDRLRLVSSAAFLGQDHSLEWLIDGMLVRGQPGIVGGMKKTLKTSIVVDLAASVGLGPSTRFLGRFEVQGKKNVGVYSGESGGATMQETLRRVCQSKDRNPNDCSVHWCFNLPQLSQSGDLRQVAREIRARELEVVIFDPIYLSLLAGNSSASAANLFDIGPLLKAISDTCLDAGATPIFVHHNTKPRGHARTGDVPQLEDLAFAGFQEFARQWLLVGRRLEYKAGSGKHQLWLNVGGSAGFSGCYGVDIDEGTVNTDFQGRRWQVLVRTEARQREVDKSQHANAQDEKTAARRENDESRVMQALQHYPNGATLTTLRDSSGVGARTLQILDAWVGRSKVVRCEVEKPCGRGTRAYEGYKLNLLPVPFACCADGAGNGQAPTEPGGEQGNGQVDGQDSESNEDGQADRESDLPVDGDGDAREQLLPRSCFVGGVQAVPANCYHHYHSITVIRSPINDGRHAPSPRIPLRASCSDSDGRSRSNGVPGPISHSRSADGVLAPLAATSGIHRRQCQSRCVERW